MVAINFFYKESIWFGQIHNLPNTLQNNASPIRKLHPKSYEWVEDLEFDDNCYNWTENPENAFIALDFQPDEFDKPNTSTNTKPILNMANTYPINLTMNLDHHFNLILSKFQSLRCSANCTYCTNSYRSSFTYHPW